MTSNQLDMLIAIILTSLFWLILMLFVGSKKPQVITETKIKKEDSIIYVNSYEYDKYLEEEIELYEIYRTYEDAQLEAKKTYRTTRDTILRIDTITKVDVIKLVTSCDSVIEKDSLIINNYEQQIEVKDKMINNLNESKDIFKSRVETLQQNEVELVKQNEKLKKKNKRRLKTALISTGVAVGSVLLLFL